MVSIVEASGAGTPYNHYVIDIESGAETARLIEQDYLFTQAMGGLFPEQLDLTHVERMLDIGRDLRMLSSTSWTLAGRWHLKISPLVS